MSQTLHRTAKDVEATFQRLGLGTVQDRKRMLTQGIYQEPITEAGPSLRTYIANHSDIDNNPRTGHNTKGENDA